MRTLQCAAQHHAAASSVNTNPDSSGSIPVTWFFVETVVRSADTADTLSCGAHFGIQGWIRLSVGMIFCL